MKRITRTAALVLSIVMTLSLLAACGGSGTHTVFTVEDVTSSAADQQRWLKYPASKLVINPDALTSKDTYSDENNTMSALDIGIVGEDGSVKYVIDDAMFFLESSSANGLEGEEVWVGGFTDSSASEAKYKGIGKIPTNESTGDNLKAKTGADAVPLTAPFKQDLGDYSTYYYAILNVETCTGTITVTAAMTKPSATQVVQTITGPGVYVIDLTSTALSSTENPSDGRTAGINLNLSANAEFAVSKVSIKAIPRALNKASKPAATKWTPYCITSNSTYPNGTAIQVEDCIMGSAVARHLTCTANGVVYVGGKINGTTEYISDNNQNHLQVTGNGYKYVIETKRKGVLTFYNSEEDLLGQVNSTDTQTSSSQYWLMTLPSATVDGTDFALAVAASETEDFEALKAAADTATSLTKVKRFLNEAVDWYNAFIAAYDVSAYIENMPK